MTARITELSLPAPAKLNLFLHILGRRSDGYHQLQTVFQLLDAGDNLHFRVRHDGRICFRCTDTTLAHDDNLVVQAAHLLKTHTGVSLGADITLDKHLPAGGGLGGGSSDAATTLLGLSTLWEVPTNLHHLAALGLRLGADVPVFVHGHSCWAEGVGEQIQPMALPHHWFVVLTPDCHVSTAEVFHAQELTRNTPPITMATFLRGGGHNDCQPVVLQRYPRVDDAFRWLSRFAATRMTGTGASVFAVFDSMSAAQAVLAQRPAHFTGFVARGVNVSPAHRILTQDYWGIAKR